MSDSKTKHSEAELEALLHQQLRGLPMPKAPASLGPRVLAAMAAREQIVWWRQPFWAWPRLAQVALLALGLPLCGGFFTLGWMLGTSGTFHQILQQVIASGIFCWDGAATLAHAASLVMRSGLQPWLLAGLAISTVMYLLCLGAGSAVLRLAYRRL